MSPSRKRSVIDRLRALARKDKLAAAPGVVVTPDALSPSQTLATRTFVAVLLFAVAFALLWSDRDGLHDQADGEVSIPTSSISP